MKKFFMTFVSVLCCTMAMTMFVACSEDDNSGGVVPGVDSRIVGNWCSKVTGMTYAKWNYGDAWQNTEFKADGTGSTRIYYTVGNDAVGCEKIDFTYTASSTGDLVMTPKDREKMKAKWQLVGDELRLGDGESISLKFEKTPSDMANKFDTWSKDEEMYEVPKPAKYTVFVYGNAGGEMDNVIEFGFWERVKQYLTDHDNVRVVCLYKYGKDEVNGDVHSFTGKYAEPGDIVWFELTDKTDLNKIREDGMQAIGMGEEAKKLKICDPNTLRMFLEFSSLACPADDYVFAIWGHGSGFDPMSDVPGKYQVLQSRGVMTDEWVNDEWMDMYEIYDALQAAGIERLNTLLFHNCFMGNIESLTQARTFADYILASGHMLSSDGILLTEFVRGLVETGNAESAGGLMFERSTPSWQNGYMEDADPGEFPNGDYKMIRTDKFDDIISAVKDLSDRIIALYPTQKEAIDRASGKVYRYHKYSYPHVYPFFDIADYAHKLAQETGDLQLASISNAIDDAFEEAFVHYRDVNNSNQHLNHYTLSVCLLDKNYYNYDYKAANPGMNILSNFNEGYEKCDFHKLTGWGNWLKINEKRLTTNPQNGSGGQLAE
jgi:hypothetical protein